MVLRRGVTTGDVVPLLSSFAVSSRVAAAESRVTAARLAGIPGDRRDDVGPVRRGSAGARLLAELPARPILSAEEAGEVAILAGLDDLGVRIARAGA
jgi:hypothetical protein